MEALQAIMTRRSIRQYQTTPVEEEKVEILLRAAMAAPSAGNQRPWHFVVVREPGTLKALAKTSPYAAMLPGASLAIAVCADTAREVHTGFWVQDCAAATQNLLLAARALGLGAVWLGYFPRLDRVRGAQKVLGLPEQIMPLAIVPVGYPDESKGAVDRYDTGRIHRDRW